MIILAMLLAGVLWFAVDALSKAARTDYEKEIRTGAALQAGKEALLAYIAQYAARSTTSEPGQLPCPESLNYYLAGTEGQSSTSCSNATEVAGRLPWRTLGIDQLRDGYGEPLWLVVSRGFRSPPINFATVGKISYNGTADAAVALVIAPGRAVNTVDASGTPTAPCAKVNQAATNRNDNTVNPLNPALFLECGNSTGAYGNPGNMTGWSPWSNDRVLAITAKEWADAIAPALADRLQRQVAPALEDWRNVQSLSNWSRRFLPYASTFGDPATNDFCGNYGVREGLPPVASRTSAACSTSWTGGAVAPLLGLLPVGSCTSGATAMTCTYTGLATLAGVFGARITATAPLVASSFRDAITAANITTAGGATVSNFSLTLSPATGDAALSFDVGRTGLVSLSLASITVTVPNVPDAAILSDARMAWFVDNNWGRHTYYALSEAASVNPGASACPGAACLSVDGTADKRLVLAMMGPRAVGAQAQPSSVATDYLESHATSTTTYTSDRVTSTFNDRLAACPQSYPLHGGGTTTVCN
jgi:hypothetical protein